MTMTAMDQERQALPTDSFSVRFRKLTDNPGAVRATSKIDLIDDYGHTESWIVDTFRVQGGAETVFLQRINVDGGLRLVLPPQVTQAIDRQHERATTQNRKRGAKAAMATRIARGDVLGNPEALKLARRRQGKTRSAR